MFQFSFHSFRFFFFVLHSFFLLGTPSARPILWMVKQVSTEVKKLRERAERSQDNSNANIRLAMKYNCDEKMTV